MHRKADGGGPFVVVVVTPLSVLPDAVDMPMPMPASRPILELNQYRIPMTGASTVPGAPAVRPVEMGSSGYRRR
ncbi:MAG TPA: hypothetical protein VGM06_01710 [Polyangiaceae bacterium]